MTQETQTEMIFKSELLQNTAQMIKDAGYKVFYSVWKTLGGKPSYFHFTDGTKIGYCQEAYFGGIQFSTVHKPSTQAGTGFALNDDPGNYNPTIKDAEKALSHGMPGWFIRRAKGWKPTKYESWEEYAAKNNSPKYVEF